jgi:hypothetical protein
MFLPTKFFVVFRFPELQFFVFFVVVVVVRCDLLLVLNVLLYGFTLINKPLVVMMGRGYTLLN